MSGVAKGSGPPVALSTSSVYPESTRYAFDVANRLGYDGVEVMVWTDPVSQDLSALKGLAEHYGVDLSSINWLQAGVDEAGRNEKVVLALVLASIGIYLRLGSGFLPATDEGLPDKFAKQLFEMSSSLTPFMVGRAKELGMPAGDGARGFVFNAQPVQVIQFLDIGTRPANLR